MCSKKTESKSSGGLPPEEKAVLDFDSSSIEVCSWIANRDARYPTLCFSIVALKEDE
jgi:hypothetical protein